MHEIATKTAPKKLPVQDTSSCTPIKFEELFSIPNLDPLAGFAQCPNSTEVTKLFQEYFVQQSRKVFHFSHLYFHECDVKTVERADGGIGFYTTFHPFEAVLYALPTTLFPLFMFSEESQRPNPMQAIQSFDQLLSGNFLSKQTLAQHLQMFMYEVSPANPMECVKQIDCKDKKTAQEQSEITGARYVRGEFIFGVAAACKPILECRLIIL